MNSVGTSATFPPYANRTELTGLALEFTAGGGCCGAAFSCAGAAGLAATVAISTAAIAKRVVFRRSM